MLRVTGKVVVRAEGEEEEEEEGGLLAAGEQRKIHPPRETAAARDGCHLRLDRTNTCGRRHFAPVWKKDSGCL